MNVLTLKLVSGEEVVVRMNGQEDGFYFVDYPQVIQVQKSSNGQLGLAFVPWMLSNPDASNVPIAISMVMSALPPSEQVEKQYITQTSKILLS